MLRAFFTKRSTRNLRLVCIELRDLELSCRRVALFLTLGGRVNSKRIFRRWVSKCLCRISKILNFGFSLVRGTNFHSWRTFTILYFELENFVVSRQISQFPAVDFKTSKNHRTLLFATLRLKSNIREELEMLFKRSPRVSQPNLRQTQPISVAVSIRSTHSRLASQQGTGASTSAHSFG